jgi:hypothetical protein
MPRDQPPQRRVLLRVRAIEGENDPRGHGLSPTGLILPRSGGLDHDDFGLNQSKIINVIDS